MRGGPSVGVGLGIRVGVLVGVGVKVGEGVLVCVGVALGSGVGLGLSDANKLQPVLNSMASKQSKLIILFILSPYW